MISRDEITRLTVDKNRIFRGEPGGLEGADGMEILLKGNGLQGIGESHKVAAGIAFECRLLLVRCMGDEGPGASERIGYLPRGGRFVIAGLAVGETFDVLVSDFPKAGDDQAGIQSSGKRYNDGSPIE